MKTFYLFLLFNILCFGISAEGLPTDSTKINILYPFDTAKKAFGASGYLNAVDTLESIKMLYPEDHPYKEILWQASLTYNSFIQNNNESQNLTSKFYRKIEKDLPISFYDAEALDFIKGQIKDRQVVMINEQHWKPNHRYLCNKLLQYMYDNGFRYLAAEAIEPTESDSLNLRGYPLQNTGIYTKEPQFGNMIRQALKIGYKLIAYEAQNDREVNQAKNIYSQTIEKDPDAKVLVWAGIAHIYKNKSRRTMMAYYFKELSGIDPLCINQASGDIYTPLLKDKYLAISADTSRLDVFDMLIYNNIKENDYEIIPDAITRNITVDLSDAAIDKIKKGEKVLMSVYRQEEFTTHHFQAVPVLNYLLTETSAPTIKLPEESYIIIIKDVDNTIDVINISSN